MNICEKGFLSIGGPSRENIMVLGSAMFFTERKDYAPSSITITSTAFNR